MNKALLRLAILLTALLASTAQAAEKVTLRAAAEPGQTWTFDRTQDADVSNNVSAGGMSQVMRFKMRSHLFGRAEVLAAKDGVPTTLRITFDPGSAMVGIGPDGNENPLPMPYAGKTLTVTRGADGSISDDFAGQADPSLSDEVHGMLDSDAAVMPGHAIAVGEEWPADGPTLARAMALRAPDDRAGMTLKLLGVRDVDGRRVADVKVSVAMQTKRQGMANQMTGQGSAVVDLSTGHILKTDLKGSGKTSGDQAGANGGQYHIEGTVGIASASSSALAAGAGAPVGPAGANPAPAAAATPAGKGFSEVARTDSGMAVAASFAGATTVRAGLRAALPELARQFDAAPTIVGAYEDNRTHRTGGASFSAAIKGRPVKGMISCQAGDAGAMVQVLYCRADATQGQWNQLVAAVAKQAQAGSPAPAPGSANAGGNANVPPAAQIALAERVFPDGTGSIGIAPGWRTESQSAAQTIRIEGPANQTLSIGFTVSVVTPNSQAVQMQRQLEAQARQLGSPPPPPMQLLVAPFTGPADALKNLCPQLSHMSQRNNGPAFGLDELTELQQLQSQFPNGKAALLSYHVTRGTRGVQTGHKALAQAVTTPIGADSWMFYMIEASSPDATFDRDLPVMLAMLQSLKSNDQAIQQRSRESIDASNQRFQAQQSAHRAQTAAFDSYLKTIQHNSVVQSRSVDNFSEVIRGYRTVEDTTTGERHSVDLGNVDHIVDKLNEGDPGRYVQIPLRDESNPLPGGR